MICVVKLYCNIDGNQSVNNMTAKLLRLVTFSWVLRAAGQLDGLFARD